MIHDVEDVVIWPEHSSYWTSFLATNSWYHDSEYVRCDFHLFTSSLKGTSYSHKRNRKPVFGICKITKYLCADQAWEFGCGLDNQKFDNIMYCITTNTRFSSFELQVNTVECLKSAVTSQPFQSSQHPLSSFLLKVEPPQILNKSVFQSETPLGTSSTPWTPQLLANHVLFSPDKKTWSGVSCSLVDTGKVASAKSISAIMTWHSFQMPFSHPSLSNFFL